MVGNSQLTKARTFKKLHADGVVVLPNAWDAASAAIVADAGAKAVATTSGGVAWSVGRPDGQGLSRQEAAEQVRRIAQAVHVPVTADVEGGYGPTPADVAKTVTAIVEAGAVGVNIEDSLAPGGPLHTVGEQAQRLRAGRDAATAAGLPELFVNVRTDVFLFGIGEPADRFDDVLARTRAYADAGADSIFVPGLTDLETLTALVTASPLPVNVMAGPGAPSVAEFEHAGVRRVSLGTAIAQSAYATAQRAANEVLKKGSYDELVDAVDYGTLNGFFVD